MDGIFMTRILMQGRSVQYSVCGLVRILRYVLNRPLDLALLYRQGAGTNNATDFANYASNGRLPWPVAIPMISVEREPA